MFNIQKLVIFPKKKTFVLNQPFDEFFMLILPHHKVIKEVIQLNKNVEFPKEFLWGSATSAPQTEGAYNEGGKALNIFDQWFLERPQDFYQEIGPLDASNVYYQYKEDVQNMSKVGLNSFRTSISWSRLMPDGINVNQEAVEFYNDYINEMINNGIQPMMNLFHYDMPVIMQEKGGFENREVCYLFVNYAKKAFELFGNRVKMWSTFNEPKAQPYGAYLCKEFPNGYPPFEFSAKKASQVVYNMALTTALCVKAFRTIVPDGEIGLIEDSVPQIPKSQMPEDIQAADYADALRNRVFLDIATKGEFNPIVINLIKRFELNPKTEAGDCEVFKENTIDFAGLTYYRPERIEAPEIDIADLKNFDKLHFDYLYHEYHPTNVRMNESRGWEIYPKAIYDIAMDMKNNYGNMRWFIAENGMGVMDEEKFMDEEGIIQDDYRISFIEEHLAFLSQAIKEGSNCFGYHIWTFADCWSWRNAYKNRYGLYRIDLDNQFKRIPKKSSFWFREYIKKVTV